jgi:hypothetical protein
MKVKSALSEFGLSIALWLRRVSYKVMKASRSLFYRTFRRVRPSLFARHYSKWYRWQFEILPYRPSFFSNEGEFESLVIIPMDHLHDSGFRCMAFVGIRDDKPVCRLAGCSDILHVEGIGGWGQNWLRKYGGVPELVPSKAWCFDCLPNGLLRIFCAPYKITVGLGTSSFEIFGIKPGTREAEMNIETQVKPNT